MMRTLRSAASALVEGRIIVGGAAAAIASVTSSVLGVPLSLPLGVALFAATVLIYNLDELCDRRGGTPHGRRVARAMAPAACLILAAALPSLRTATALVLALGLPACALYALPLGFLGGARLKDHAVGKVGYVAAAVTTATVLLPCVEAGVTPTGPHAAIAAVWVFSTMLGNALACDLRDRERDALHGPRTLAVVLGGAPTYRLLVRGHLWALPVALGAVCLGLAPIATVVPIAIMPLALRLLQSSAPPWAWGLLLDGAFLPMALLV